MSTNRKIVSYISVVILVCCFWVYKQGQQNKLPYVSASKLQIPINEPDKSKRIVPEKEIQKVLIVSGGLSVDTKNRRLTEREKYSAFLQNHPFNNRVSSEENKEEGEDDKPDRPDLAWEQDFLRTMDPKLKRPTPEVLPDIIRKNHLGSSSRIQTLGIPGAASTPWAERGPNNVGGRTRALVWDPNDVNFKKVWAGGVTGGLWYNNDITDVNSGWNRVDDFWANIAVSCIAFDPNNPLIAYAGTGEGFGVAGASNPSSLGAGIWKTIDGGNTWSQISSTASFAYVNDIVVRNENGTSKIYAAVDGWFYYGEWHNSDKAGLQTSSNGGSTWSQVLPKVPTTSINFVPASISIGKDNRIWVGTKASPYDATDRGGGNILFSDNGTSWTTSDKTIVTNGYGRVTVACAPSDANYIYAFVEDNHKFSTIRKTIDNGVSWVSLNPPVDADNGIPSWDFTRGQAWYDQALKIDPNDPKTVIIGGVDLFRTSDGGNNWKQISQWANFSLAYSIVHADQHAISFKPGSSSTVIFGNDGGIFYTTSVSTAATNNVIAARNKNYNVTQFYAAAVHPASGSNSYLAGAQDNGTQRFSSAGINSTTVATTGDGAYCFIDQLNPSYQIASYVYNNYYLSTDGGNTFPANSLISDGNTGSFINPSCYDNNQHILYTYKASSNTGSGSIYAVKNITSTPVVSTVNIGGMKDAVTAFKVSPYTTTSTTLFIGTAAGDLFKIINANGTPTVTSIGSLLPIGSISCIETGSNENELLVTYFNYGISKIWYSQDGGTTWVDKSGNFPNIPARWALFNPNKRANEVILATELGIYATTNFSSASPTWTSSNTGFANVRTDMLQLRDADYQVIAATHGRGLFSSNAFSEASAPSITSFLPTSAAIGATITITGSNFTNASTVSFGGTVASSFTVTSSTGITATVGAGSSGNVSVTTPGGIASKSGFSFVLAPTITSFTPVNAGNGTIVTITGTNFIAPITVSFGGTAALTPTVVSPTTITAVVDTGASGSVSVTTSAGTAIKTGFTFFAAPTITSFLPTAVAAGTTITITGTNFSNVLDVSFGGTTASAFTATSSTNITAILGGGSTGDLTVTTPGGTATKIGFSYIALPKPNISGFSPSIGPVGTAVTITGSNFSTNAANYIVYFGAVKAAISAVTATTIAVTVPVGATYQPISVLEKNTGLISYTSMPFLVTFTSKNAITTVDLATKVDFNTSTNANGIAIGDIDGDGKSDIVVANSDDNTISIYRNISVSGSITSASFAAKVDFATGDGPNSVAIADLDGDGKLDIAVSTINSTTVSVLRNTATSGTISTTSLATKVDFNIGFVGSRFVAINDLNGDGKAELAVVNGSTNTISVLKNTATPGNINGSSFAAYVSFSTGIAPRGLAIGDIDGDNKSELFVANSDLFNNTNTVSILRNTENSGNINSSSFAAKLDLNTAITVPIWVAIGDLDGDGKQDLITVMHNSGNNVNIFRNIAISGSITTASFAPRIDLSTGQFPEPSFVALGDMDGDGKPDILTSNGTGNTLSIFRNTSTSGIINNTTFLPNVDFGSGIAPLGLVIGDLDGDGKPDLVGLNTGSGTLSVFRNNPQYPPTISSFSPTSAGTGATITITGTEFTSEATVSFGVTQAVSVTFVSPTTITAVVGSGSSGNVSVTNLGGTGTLSGFTFIPAPTITTFLPTNAATGAVVTITGTNFSNVISVSFGGTTATFTPVSATTIAATVGLGSTGSVSVTTPGGTATKSGFIYCSPPTVTASGATTFCNGGSVILTSSSATGNQWYKDGIAISGAMNTTYSANASGSYTDTATITGSCKNGSLATTVLVNALPAVPVISAGGPTTFCSGGTVLITSSSGTFNQWYKDGVLISGATGSTYTANVSGSFTDTVSNIAGCKSGSTAIVITVKALPSIPIITSNGPLSFCSGGSVVLSSSGGTWYKDGLAITGPNNSSYTTQTGGSYTDTVINASGCKAGSATTIVTVNAFPATPAITVNSATTFCSGGIVILTSTSATGNQWYKDSVAIAGATNPTYTATGTGSFTVKVTNTNSCSATSASTSVTVNTLPAIPTISAGGPLVFCDTGKVILTSSAVTGNQWYKGTTAITGATNSIYSANQTGSYSVIVTNSNNCTATSTAIAVTANAMPVKPTITRNNADLISSGLTGNQWYNDATVISNATAQNFRPSLSGYYKVQVSSTGCIGPLSDPYYYLVTSVINIVGNTIGSYKLIPNPATERLLVQAVNTNNKITIQIIATNGRMTFNQEFTGNITIDMSFFTPGMYTVLLTDYKTKKQESKQIIKQ